MDDYSERIAQDEDISHFEFESEVYSLAPAVRGYHQFCEIFARLHMENRMWGEVFYALYGDMPKFKGL